MTMPDWDLLIYAFAGDDKDAAAVGRAITALQAAELDAQTRVFVQVHAKGGATRVRLRPGVRQEEALPEIDAARGSTLRDFLDATAEPGDARATAPAPPRATALILYGHGSGLDEVYRKPTSSTLRQFTASYVGKRRLGPDPESGEFLTNWAVRDAIARSSRRRVEILAFNACSMAMLEIAEELRDVCTFLLASQVDATLWPYDALAATLARAPRCSAETLVSELLACVSSQLADDLRHDSLSAFRTSHIARLTSAFSAYAQAALPLLQSRWDDVRDAVVIEAQRVYDPYQVDLLSLTRRLAARHPELAAAATAVEVSFREARFGSVAHSSRGDVHGLSLFCPTDVEVELARAYAGTRFAHTAWATFLHQLQQRLMQL